MGNCHSEKAAKNKNEEQHEKAIAAAQHQEEGKVSKAENQAMIDASQGAKHSKEANQQREVDSKIETEVAKAKAREAAKKDEQKALVENKETEAEVQARGKTDVEAHTRAVEQRKAEIDADAQAHAHKQAMAPLEAVQQQKPVEVVP